MARRFRKSGFSVTGIPVSKMIRYFFIAIAFVIALPLAPDASASATVILDPATLSLSSISGQANSIRYLYYLINGPKSGYEIQGPSTGFVGIINDIVGENGLGQALRSEGVFTCASIPDSGSYSKEISGSTYSLTISESTLMTVPSHFGTSASETFDKSLTITRDGASYVYMEIKCSSRSTVTTGYLRMDTGLSSDRKFETYFQQDSETHASYVDFFEDYSNDTEKIASRFVSTDGNEYRLWLIKTQSSNDSAQYFGIHGNHSANLVQLHILNPSGGTALTNASNIQGASVSSCIAMGANAASSQCSSYSLAVIDPVQSTAVGGTAFGWTISATAGLTLTSLP